MNTDSGHWGKLWLVKTFHIVFWGHLLRILRELWATTPETEIAIAKSALSRIWTRQCLDDPPTCDFYHFKLKRNMKLYEPVWCTVMDTDRDLPEVPEVGVLSILPASTEMTKSTRCCYSDSFFPVGLLAKKWVIGSWDVFPKGPLGLLLPIQR